MTQKIPVTVVVPVKNEEKNLPECLKLLGDFSQVMVIDSGSTDRTPEITKEFGYEYHLFEWNGMFPKKRNWVLRNLDIKNEWVFFLDADEFITNDFIQELKHKINDSSVEGFWLNYSNIFMGKQLKHGYPLKKLALFRKGAGEYERIEEDHWSHLDMEVHEHPQLKGKVSQIKTPITHNDYKGLEHYIAKHNAYSSWEANRFLSMEKNTEAKFTRVQKIKYALMKSGMLPFFYFLGAYVLLLGFLDGKAGYYLARYKANYFFQIQTKIRELRSGRA